MNKRMLVAGVLCAAACSLDADSGGDTDGGFAIPTIRADGLGRSRLGCIAADATNVYAVGTAPGVLKVPHLVGSPPVVLAPDVGDACVVLYEDSLLLTDEGDPTITTPTGRLLEVPLIGGQARVLLEQIHAAEVARVGSNLLLAGQNTLSLVALPSMDVTELVVLGDYEGWLELVAGDSTHAYYLKRDSLAVSSSVERVSLAGGDPDILIPEDALLPDSITAMTLAEGFLYLALADEQYTSHQLVRADVDSFNVTMVAAWDGCPAARLFHSGAHMYMSEDCLERQDDYSLVCDSRVLAVSTASGDVSVVAKDQNSPGGIAALGGEIYWRNRGRGWPGDVVAPGECADGSVLSRVFP